MNSNHLFEYCLCTSVVLFHQLWVSTWHIPIVTVSNLQGPSSETKDGGSHPSHLGTVHWCSGS
jgi:hypothetical protein